MHLNIFYWMEVEKLLVVHNISNDELSGYFGVGQSFYSF